MYGLSISRLLTLNSLDTLGAVLAPSPIQTRAMNAKRVYDGNRSVRDYFKGQKHRDAAVAGGGAREVARRARQIAAGQLQVSR
jgi:hypothetical protein